jgi:hypothetical protein
MSSTKKGVLVALVTVVVVAIQIATLGQDVGDMVGWLITLSLVAIPFGAYMGVLAGSLREDRIVTLVGIALAAPSFLAFITLMVSHRGLNELANRMMTTAGIPIVFAALALERWTRPAAEIPLAVPERRAWRKPTAMEVGVIASLVVAAAVTVMLCLTKHPHPEEYTQWYKYTSPIDTAKPHMVFLFLAGSAVPIGALLGRLASRTRRGRLVVLATVGAVGTIWVGSLVAFFSPIAFRGIYVVPGVLAVIAIERLTKPRELAAAPLSAVSIGMLCGVGNAIAISLGMMVLVMEEEHWRWDWEMVAIPTIAILFSLPAGAILGGMAGRVRNYRKLWLQLVAIGGVLMLALCFDLPIRREPSALGILLWSCCTTAIGVHILERATRHGSDPHGAGTGEALRDAESAGGSVVRS